jgi:hypothetical protein
VDNLIQLRLSYVGSRVNRKGGWSQIGLQVGNLAPSVGNEETGSMSVTEMLRLLYRPVIGRAIGARNTIRAMH